jgi:hypothetical protein
MSSSSKIYPAYLVAFRLTVTTLAHTPDPHFVVKAQ